MLTYRAHEAGLTASQVGRTARTDLCRAPFSRFPRTAAEHDRTLLCTRGGCGGRSGTVSVFKTLAPELEDSAREVTLECTVRLAAGFLFRGPASKVGLGGRQVAGLRDGDSKEQRVQATIAATVQAVAHSSGGGCFEWRHAGIGCEACVGPKAGAGAKDTGQRPGGEKVDPAQSREWFEMPFGKLAYLHGHLVRLVQSELQASCQAANHCHAYLAERVWIGDGVFLCGGESPTGANWRQMELVLRIELHQLHMKLIPQPSGISEGGIAFDGQQIEHTRLVILVDVREAISLLENQRGDRRGVESVCLAGLAGVQTSCCRPPRVDLVDRLAGRHEVLRQPATIAPGAFHSESAVFVLGADPVKQVPPASGTVLSSPVGELAAEYVEGHGYVNSLMGVYTQSSAWSLLLRCAQAPGLTIVSAVRMTGSY